MITDIPPSKSPSCRPISARLSTGLMIWKREYLENVTRSPFNKVSLSYLETYMPINYSITANTLWLRGEGAYGLKEIKAAVESAFQDPRFVKGMPVLVDKRKATINRSEDELRAIAAYYLSIKDSISPRFAIVAATPIVFGMSRMFEAYVERGGLMVQVFTEVGDAVQYLKERG